MARKDMPNWVSTISTMATMATLGKVRMVGGVGPEGEEVELAEEAEPAASPRAALEARLDRAFAEPDYERGEIFEYLREFRRQKRLKQRLEREDEAREKARAELDLVLREEAAKRRKSEPATGEAMNKNAVVTISSVEEGNGKPVRALARRRTPADGIQDDIYVQDENGELVSYDPPPRRFTQEDRERADRNRDRRHTRSWYAKQLLAVAEGRLILTKEQYHALVTLGRLKGWNRRPSTR